VTAGFIVGMSDADEQVVEREMQGPAALIRHICGLLEAEGCVHVPDSSGTSVEIFEEAEVGSLCGSVSAELVEAEEEMILLQVAFAMPIMGTDPEKGWPRLCELMALLNPHLTIGLLEYEHETSELRWRANQLLKISGPWSDAQVMTLLHEGMDIIERLFETASKVLVAGDDPNIAVAEMLLDGGGSESNHGFFESEILSLLRRARRNIDPKDVPTIDRVAKLVVRLTFHPR